ncbi:MAG: tRNA lysidine(34) synthetase TilS [Anaerorhabdus sp.]
MFNNLVNKKWIVAVSGGPDSMALLDMCVKAKIEVVVAHVNYHKRDTADRDENCVKVYCNKHNVKVRVIHPVQKRKQNFQAWARDVRYDFFKECVRDEDAAGLLVGHHQDDLIETYLFQQKRKSIPSTYGIASVVEFEGMTIVRPLLNMSKQECANYCLGNDVPFQIDESNLKSDYTRNKIRHEIVEKMSREEKIKILNEINNLNINKEKEEEEINKLLQSDKLNYREIINDTTRELRINLLREYFKKNKQVEYTNSRDYFEQLEHVLSTKLNYELELKHGILLLSNQICEIVGKEDKSYSYVLQSLSSLQTPYFTVLATGTKGVNAVTVSGDDFPLTIRSIKDGDAINLRFGTKKINRWFIDRKIPLKDRKEWPVVLNCKNEVILVPGIGCNVEHYSIKPNLFVIKY